MSSLLTNSDILSATGALGDHFDTFSREIIVFKKPSVELNNPNTSIFPGYGVQESNIQSYSQSYRSFRAIIRFVGEQNSDFISQTKTVSPGNALCRIKVKEDCKNYIEDGLTEYILVDGIYGTRCNVYSEPALRVFLGLRYFEYWLTQVS